MTLPDNAARITQIEQRLNASFSPTRLAVTDDSHLHVGHAGARSGRGHFTLLMRARAMEGLAPLAQHRAVYAALGSLMDTDIHALALDLGGADKP